MSKTKVLICPYCGETQPHDERCRSCGGLFEPLSRQATHNAMGPWFLRDPDRPFQPGCSYETLVRLVDRGVVTRYSIIRGPTSKQFWTVAKHVAGIAHLLGYCHACDGRVDPEDHGCHACGVPFGAFLDRNYMGLPEVQAMPWEPGDPGAPAARTGMTTGFDPAWVAPAPTDRLSSFAPDDEILEVPSTRAAPPTPRPGVSPGPPRQNDAPVTRPAAVVTPSSADPTEGDDPTASPVFQSMRRRIAGQGRTIKKLWIALGVLVLLSAIELVLLLSAGGGAG